MTDHRRLALWAFIHAIAMLVAGALSFAFRTPIPLVAAAAGSFGGLAIAFRRQWTPEGRFGLANAITALRLGGSLALVYLGASIPPGILQALLWIALFALDAADGYVARRRGLASPFGAFFDKESDALFVGVLGFALYIQDLLGAWVLLLGALRYVFVIAMQFVRVDGEFRSRSARYIYVTCVIALLAAFVLPPLPAAMVAVAGGSLLTFSFLRYFYWLAGQRAPAWVKKPGLPGFLLAFAALNGLLLLPAYLGVASTSTFFPVPETASPTTTLTWSRGWYDIALYVFVRRPNQDLFRLSFDLTFMVFVLVWFRASPRRAAIRRTVVALYLFLVAFEAYESLALSFFHRPGLLFEDARYLVNLYYLLLDSFSPRYAGWLYAALCGLGLLLSLVPRLFGLMDRALDARRLADTVRYAALVFIPVTAGLWAWYGPLANGPTLRSTLPRVTANAASSIQFARQERARQFERVDSTYFGYDALALTRRPPIYMILIESYGRILEDDPTLNGTYHALMDTLDTRLRAGGWHAATTTSTAPITGGLSWLSMNTALSGLTIDNRTTYLRYLSRVDAYPHLVRFLDRHGYETISLQPPTRARPGLPAENPLAFDRTVYFDDLRYTGKPYSIWIIPDQYSLNYTHAHYIPDDGSPYFLFFETASTHAPWDDTPPLVADWRQLNRADAPPAAPPLTLADKLAASIRDHLQQPRGDASTRYMESIVYDFEVLVRYILEDAPEESIFLILGDHQPPVLRSEHFDTPAHVIVRDTTLLDRFQPYGFRPGMRITPLQSPINHGGLYSMLVDVLTADADVPLPGPAYRPAGISSSILWKTE
ncbi:MAG: CDP-alcohol phosphatidyltransferase family protein [Rhodothermales bacterium]